MEEMPEDVAKAAGNAYSRAVIATLRIANDPTLPIARAILAERERCAKVADEHRSRVPFHEVGRQSGDLVAHGYGNAALNIAAAIRAGEAHP